MMLNRPRFKPHLRVEVISGEGVYVLAEGKKTLLRGRLYELVAPCLDGRSVDEIRERLEAEASAAEVYFVLSEWERKGFLCEANDSTSPGEAALWSAQQVDPNEAARRLTTTPMTVRGFGVDPSSTIELLRGLGVRVEEEGRFGLVLADGYLRTELEVYNEKALRENRPWLLVRPVGGRLWIGPLFRPGSTGCWACLAERIRANSPVESYLKSRSERSGGSALFADIASSPATLQVALGLASHAAASWIGRGELAALEGKIQELDLVAWNLRPHSLTRLPYCPACGSKESPETKRARPIVLESRLKTVSRDGGHRTVAPEVTLERYERHVSPITGAVNMLERIGSANNDVFHVYLAGHNLAGRHQNLDHLRGGLRNMSSGKGSTDAQARAGGLCEGLERYSAVFRGDEPRRKSSLRRLGDDALDLRDCLLFSERQYRERDVWNARKSQFNFIPVPFDPDAEIEWTPVWSLTRRRERYLPTAFCYFNYPQTPEKTYCRSCSNGNAAGNTLEEAILQGFLELVERDAVALWWYNRLRRPAFDLNSVADPYLDRLQTFLQDKGRELWALDLTSDLGVPVFVALTRNVDREEERIVLGFGAHFDPKVAITRAVTEMNQMLSSLIAEPDRQGLPEHITDPVTVDWLRKASVLNQPYIQADRNASTKTLADYPTAWSDDIAENARACQRLVENLGMEMLVLDQTRPEIGLPVVKTIVPGLRHFWARFAPGRLYDVPVRMGWLDAPIAEEDLNPIPMFL